MDKRIEEEVAGRPVEEVDELILDECPTTNLTLITDVYVNLEKLSAVGCGLTTLKGFPNLPNLRKLDLSNNKLSDGELAYLVGCQALTNLNISGNCIKDVASLDVLKKLKSLRKLDMMSCGVNEDDDYRPKVFEMLDQIIYLDGVDRDDQEDEDESEVEDLDGDEDDENGEEGSEDDDENSEGSVGELEHGADDDEEDDDEDEDDDEEDAQGDRGTKRKHEEEEDVWPVSDDGKKKISS